MQVSSKIDVIKTLLEKADKVIIVGGMVFTFDKAQGKAVSSVCGICTAVESTAAKTTGITKVN